MLRCRPAQLRARWFVLLLGIGLLLVLAISVAGKRLPPLWAFSVHRSITATMARQHIPGLSVAVVSNGSLRWSTGYGLADVENHIPADAATVYRWASVSKPVTAVAVMQLAERGKIDLDAPIQMYASSFPVKPWPITSRQLLGHLGGIRHYQGDERYSTTRYAHFTDAADVFRDDPLVCEPGTRHVYTSYGYNLLGEAVEAASGLSYMDYLAEQVFRPAQMTTVQAADTDDEGIIPHFARGYVKTGEGIIAASRPVDLSGRIPGGGLVGTAEDAARFAIALQSETLLKRATLAAMFTRQTTRDGQVIEYGLGWSLSRHNHRNEVWHAGHTPGASTLLYMLPDRKFAVALMTNLEGAQILDLAREIAEMVAPGPGT